MHMVTLDMLNHWLATSQEDEHLDFKEAKHQYNYEKLLCYCVAFANEKGGHFVLGVTDKIPRKVVGTDAFPNLNDIKTKILNALNIRVEIHELKHPDGRVLVFEIPSRPIGHPLELKGAYYMRSGEGLVAMTADQLRKIFAEGNANWFLESAKDNASPDEVIALLDTQTYFELLKRPYPTTRDAVLSHLTSERLITTNGAGWMISNLAAILLAKRLDDFSLSLARKAVRVIIYKGTGKIHTQQETVWEKGYAVGFENLVDFVYAAAPQNYFTEELLREEIKMFPKQALRELIANSLTHQDFFVTGASVMIELYTDRIEISNPGLPPISVEHFIDEYRSRNEILANFIRRLSICEEKGSGIDKVIEAVEALQLPAPDFIVGQVRTTAILFAHKNFSDMSKKDRIRACYQHCVLLYVHRKRMSNQTLRERFKLPESAAATISLIISAAKEAGIIKLDEGDSASTRYAKYLPFWA